MSMVIANNMQAINTKRQFANSSRGMSGAMERLSSGFKINTGKDDPSGLLISEKLRSQINGLKRAQLNTEEAINVLGIAEGALNEMNSILKKMKALAIHSASNGITSPDQIAADQAEMDSAIQTLDRIANTTKFSDQILLNGSKEITFDVETATKSTQQNTLINARESSFNQIYKRDGYSVSINFTGTQNADRTTGIGDVDFTQQAMKAYLEVDTAGGQPQPDVDAHGNFTRDQAFTITGNKGSRSFKFMKGETVANMVSQIKNSADSTGVTAALVFNSAQTINKASSAAHAETIAQYAIVNGLAAKDGSKPVTLQFSGDVATQHQEALKDMGFTITTNVTSGGAIEYTLITNDGGTATLALASGGGIVATTITGGKLDGINITGLHNVDLSRQVGIRTVSGTLSGLGGVSGSVATAGIDFSGLSDAAKKQLIGATDIDMTVTAVKTTSGSSNGSVIVTITGIGADGKAFTLETEQSAKLESGGSITLTAGDLKGLTFGIGGFAATDVGPVVAVSGKLNFTYENIGTATAGSGKILASQVNGSGSNVSSTGSVGGIRSGDDGARNVGEMAVFNNTISKDGTGRVEQGVTGVEYTAAAAASIQYGMNTDGQGRIYVKFLDDNSFELYKDAAMTEESKVAFGINGQAIKAVNNSGLEGITLNLTGQNLASKTGVYLAFAGIEGENGVTYEGSVVNNSPTGEFSGSAMFDASRTFITGIELGTNTSEDGEIFLKSVYDHDSRTVQVFAYRNKEMRDEDLVAKSEIYSTVTGFHSGNVTGTGSMTIVLNEIRNSDDTLGTGLGIVLSVAADAFSGQSKSSIMEGSMTFTNLGARIYSEDYGSDAFVKVTQDKGAIFYSYSTAGDNSSKTLIDAGSKGTSVQVNGQDATLSVNGSQVKTQGLRLNMATQDIQADLLFNEGKVGSTTLAQVGYGVGSLFTKIGALNLGSSVDNDDGLSGLLCNAGHVTGEKATNFDNGMQLQLGEGAGDQNRTIVSLKAMDAENLGRITRGGYWETGSSVWSERAFTIKDVMGGGLASLSQDPTLAMAIIDQAISDVSENRARIGAMQTNLLQTNSNNLSVTIENIQKTESGIRDADMADEMTEFTKQQVLQNAAMSMMTQANQSAQNVLQLLR